MLCRKIPALIMLLRPKKFGNNLEIKPERPDQDGVDMYKRVSWSEKGGCCAGLDGGTSNPPLSRGEQIAQKEEKKEYRVKEDCW